MTEILQADGSPARRRSENCPECGAGPERRVQSGSFGQTHEVCGKCGRPVDGERPE
jgi:ribosomal protein S27AE